MTSQNHLTQEDFVLLHYGESGAVAALESHLAECAVCRAERDALARLLARVDSLEVPERDEDYGATVWRRLQPRLRQRPAASWGLRLAPRRWALAAALVMMLGAAFLAGRHWPILGPEEYLPISVQARERALLAAVGEHLERTQLVLVELVNANGTHAPNEAVDISGQRHRAEELVAANRLYRLTAASVGDMGLSVVLEELERVLLDVARGPSEMAPEALEAVQKRIRDKGILVRIRVIDSMVEEREKAAAPHPPSRRV